MQKLLSLLSTLTIEVNNVTKGVEIKYYDPIIMFGDSGELEPDELDEGETVIEVSRLMKCFKDIYDLVKMLSLLIKNMIYQLNAMMKKKHEPYEKLFKKIMFSEFFDKIGEGLAILVTLDIIVHENKNYIKMWTVYNKMLIKLKK